MLHDCSYYDLEEGMEVTNNHLVGLDVFREILDASLIAMRNPEKIQMCSVESHGVDTLYNRTLIITLRRQLKHSRGYATLQPCYPA